MEITLDTSCDMGYIRFGKRYPGCSKESFSLLDAEPGDALKLRAALMQMGVELKVDIAQDGTLHGIEVFDASKLFFRDSEETSIRMKNLETGNSVELNFPA